MSKEPFLYRSKKILCSICVRGGSKGVPSKNIQNLGGLPLLAHSIRQAQAAGIFQLIAVSSDCEDILKVAQKFGADILIKRPDELATDVAGKLSAIIHCAESVEKMVSQAFELFVDLDATSPLRLPEDIINAVDFLLDSGASNIISGCRARRSPYFNLVERQGNGSVKLAIEKTPPVLRRQDAPDCFDMNASIYAWHRNFFFNSTAVIGSNTHLYEMPEERSIDIDTSLDFDFVRLLLKKQKGSL
ncbi:MAG: acylneuraminate cytidylyltransferase family protein [Alphaproteobacteria bacterium]|nr:acylneuraminate cytidylyltransferase family protein [Candidatus Parcubacteria bacterium]NCQ67529.1 acylneuraminate cytidylyltransferase family protein [Alphaproteobacteria bacterium]